MREIKVIGLILPLVLGIKVAFFPWTPDLPATSKQIAQASDSSEKTRQHIHLTRQVLKKKKKKNRR